ncbi:MAG: hypothetical protein AAFX58_09140 [Pseudomonadota bacterium]
MTSLGSIALLPALLATMLLGTEGGTVLRASVDRVSGDGWTLSGLETVLVLSASGLSGEVRIERIELSATDRSFDAIGVACQALGLTTRVLSCEDAVFTANLPGIGRRTMRGSFRHDRSSGATRIALSGVALARGSVAFDLLATRAGVDARFKSSRLELGSVLAVANRLGAGLGDFEATGQVTLSGKFNTAGDGAAELAVNARFDTAAISNDAGTVATEGLHALVELQGTIRDRTIHEFELSADGDRGELYVEPVYADLSEHPVRLQVQHVETSAGGIFDVQRFRLRYGSLADIAGTANLVFGAEAEGPVRVSANLELNDTSVATLYGGLIQVQAAGTVLGNLDTDGRLSGSVTLTDNALTAANLRLDDLILDDRGGRFAVYGLDGTIDWPAAGSDHAPSTLQWDSAMVYSVVVGGGDAALRLDSHGAELLAPLRVPTMGGALQINRLALRNYGSDTASGVLDAHLEPIQLGQLTGAFGWPAFSGTLSGKLPLLQLAADTITVGGTLSARAFDGTVELSDLRIDGPFGRVPKLSGELRLRDLDLQRITETFSFGLIQGRLSGDVTGLELLNWRPVAMDMHLYTPPDDDTPHRISQRAIENLASVGGGGAGVALSSGFLRFFEVFAYERIGLRCLLRDAICSMSGVEPAHGSTDGGYYIVKGRGLPRIDVVGYRDRVSWQSLVRQLAAISASGTPTVN